ncbi:MAG: inorganic phosphate transport protein PHO88 [Piptocephalis tieghemiana]|nr:MAG: inorganic phosphate transport protein PHO88 [Piptocephalis tieghemiana]
MSSQIQTLVVMFGVMQLTSRLDLEDPEIVGKIRLAYAVAQGTVLAILGIIYFRIKAKNDRTELKYTEPSPPFTNEPGKKIVTTVQDYDTAQIWTQLQQTLMGVGIMGFMHYKWGYVQPLVFQCIIPLKTFFSTQLVQVHLFGKEALGDLRRPWAKENPMAGLLGSNNANATEVVDKREERRERKKQEKAAAAGKNE